MQASHKPAVSRIRSRLILEILVNFLLPWLAFRLAEPRWGTSTALIASAVPPIIWSMVEFVRHKRLDALSLLIIAGIVLSIVAMALGGSPTLILMRESLVTGLFGLAFLVSALLAKPLIYFLARASVAREGQLSQAQFEAACQGPDGRPAGWLRTMTLVWGAGLVGEALLRLWLIETLTPERFLLISPWISYGIFALLGVWTWRYRRKLRQQRADALPAQA